MSPSTEMRVIEVTSLVELLIFLSITTDEDLRSGVDSGKPEILAR